jgi:hypothetical protein
MSNTSPISSLSSLSSAIFELDVERKYDQEEEFLSESSTCSFKSDSTTSTNSTKRPYSSMIAEKLTFDDWLLYKRESLT